MQTSTTDGYDLVPITTTRSDGFSIQRWVGVPGFDVFAPSGECVAWAEDEVEVELKVARELRERIRSARILAATG